MESIYRAVFPLFHLIKSFSVHDSVSQNIQLFYKTDYDNIRIKDEENTFDNIVWKSVSICRLISFFCFIWIQIHSIGLWKFYGNSLGKCSIKLEIKLGIVIEIQYGVFQLSWAHSKFNIAWNFIRYFRTFFTVSGQSWSIHTEYEWPVTQSSKLFYRKLYALHIFKRSLS